LFGAVLRRDISFDALGDLRPDLFESLVLLFAMICFVFANSEIKDWCCSDEKYGDNTDHRGCDSKGTKNGVYEDEKYRIAKVKTFRVFTHLSEMLTRELRIKKTKIS
jgi:hypothetical protein